MFECESWTIKKAECWRIDAFKSWCWIDDFKLWYWRRLESPLDSKDIKPVNPKRNQPWIFVWRTDAEAEAPILWPPDVRANSLGKTLVLGNIEGKRRRGWWRMIGLDGITDLMDMSLSRLSEDSGGQGSMVCCSSWGRKESDMT